MAAVNEKAYLEVKSYNDNANRTIGDTNSTVLSLSTTTHAQKHCLGPWSCDEYTECLKKKSFTMVFKMLLCGYCSENVYT
jgi:hypothetical protein